MAVQTPTRTKAWTYKEYAALDDGKRYEVIGGDLVIAPAPETYHQDISRNLEFHFIQFAIQKNLGKVYDAPVDVVFDEWTVLQPDLIFIAKENLSIIRKEAVFGAPDLVVEILSPTSVENDRYRKREIYEKSGVREYWIVDPENRTIEVLANSDKGFSLFSFAARKGNVKSKLLEGFEASIEEVMEQVGAQDRKAGP